jgi:F420-0:gamma-glutamyl ligase
MEGYGRKDLFGKLLIITATANNLGSAAQDEADESTPAVLIRDAPAVFFDGGADIMQIRREECLYFVCFDGLARIMFLLT